jgi:hypothetical protein
MSLFVITRISRERLNDESGAASVEPMVGVGVRQDIFLAKRRGYPEAASVRDTASLSPTRIKLLFCGERG